MTSQNSGTGAVVLSNSGTVIPMITSWTLPNGLKVHYLKNPKPEKRLEIRLVVHAGSAHEGPGEEGLAHLVEHMVFNGTSSFSSGEVVKQLELLGAGYGSDVNAYTSTDATVYFLQVETKAETVKKSLQILSEFAAKPLFLKDEVEKERGVILAEKRERSGSIQKEMDMLYGMLFRGTPFAHPVIGSEESIRSFDDSSVKTFWKKWYRPDRMELILVGDVGEDIFQEPLQTYFAGIAPSAAPMPEEPVHEWASAQEPWQEVVHEDVAEVTHMLTWKGPAFSTFTRDGLKKRLMEEIFVQVLDRRVRELADAHPSVFSSASSTLEGRTNRFAHSIMLRGVFRSGHEEEGLRLLYEEYYRFLTFGMGEKEFSFMKDQFLAQEERMLTNRTSKESAMEAANITDSLVYGDKIWSMEEQIQASTDVMKEVTLTELQSLLEHTMKPMSAYGDFLRNERHVSLTTKAQDIFHKFSTMELAPYVFQEPTLVLHTFPKKKVVQGERIDTYDMRKRQLENGITLMTRHTDFDKDRVLLRVMLKGGAIFSKDSSLEAFARLFQFVSVQGLSRESLDQVLQKKQIRWNVFPTDVGLQMVIDGPSAALDDIIELVYGLMTKPTYGDSEIEKLKEAFQSDEKNILVSPDAQMALHINKALFEGRSTKLYWTAQERKDLTLAAMQKAQSLMLRSSHMEILLIGSPEESLLAQKAMDAFSTIEKEPAYSYDKEEIKRAFPKAYSEQFSFGAEPKNSVAIRFPATYNGSAHDQATYILLAQILQTKLIDSLREQSSGVYSPMVVHRIFPERLMTYMMVNFETDPKEMDHLLGVFWSSVESIKKEGIQDTDLLRARLPLLGQFAVAKKTNEYTISSVGSIFFPFPLDFTEAIAAEFSTVTTSDLNKAFVHSFSREKMVQILRTAVRE